MKRFLNWFKDFEPAQLEGLRIALFATLANIGVTIGTDVQAEVGFWVNVAIVILTQGQAILTRFKVFSPATANRLKSEAYELGRSDEALDRNP